MYSWRVSVAYRLFGTRTGNRLMSFLGLLSITGLTLAVAVLVTVLSVVNGFERELRERVLGVLPHGTIYSRQGFSDWQAELQAFQAHPDVKGVAPLVEGTGLLVNAGELQGVQFRGVDTRFESDVSILPGLMIAGDIDALAGQKFGAVIGSELAGMLGVGVGDAVSLVLPQVRYSLGGPVLTTRRLTIAGIFRVGADLDKSQVLLSLDDAMKLKRQSHIDGLVLRLEDMFDAPRVLNEIVLGHENPNLFGVSWMRQNGSLYDAIGTQKATLFLLLMILVAVAAFNVVSNLVMTVDDSKSEIAILKTMGASAADMRMIFILHGMMVCVTGLVLGLILGLLLTALLESFYASLSGFFGLNLMSEYFIRYLPVEVQAGDILMIAGVSLFICLFATVYPASRAAAANPVEVLAYDA